MIIIIDNPDLKMLNDIEDKSCENIMKVMTENYNEMFQSYLDLKNQVENATNYRIIVIDK